MNERDRQRVTESCPKQEADVQDSSAPCNATTCGAEEDTGCAQCE